MSLAEQHPDLLAAAHGGDSKALGQVLALCQPDMRRYARRSCLVSDVDDAVQEALLVLTYRLGWPGSPSRSTKNAPSNGWPCAIARPCGWS